MGSTRTLGWPVLSTVIGRTLEARRAGMIDAASDAIARIAVAAPRVNGSSGLIAPSTLADDHARLRARLKHSVDTHATAYVAST